MRSSILRPGNESVIPARCILRPIAGNVLVRSRIIRDSQMCGRADVAQRRFLRRIRPEFTFPKKVVPIRVSVCHQEPWAGAANQAGGVTIDLAGLNAIDVSLDQTRTGIGPGNRWVDVYSKLESLGLAVPGGRVSTVGVGGLVTGGELITISSWAQSVQGTD